MSTPPQQTTRPQYRKRFQYRREIQCECCHNYGHNIDQDVCRFGAQHYFVCQFINEQPEKAKANANAYHIANNKVQVTKLQANYPQLFQNIDSEEEMDNTILDIANKNLERREGIEGTAYKVRAECVLQLQTTREPR